jgi:hypothetical protein
MTVSAQNANKVFGLVGESGQRRAEEARAIMPVRLIASIRLVLGNGRRNAHRGGPEAQQPRPMGQIATGAASFTHGFRCPDWTALSIRYDKRHVISATNAVFLLTVTTGRSLRITSQPAPQNLPRAIVSA